MRYQGDEEAVVIPSGRNITILYDDLFKGHTEITSIHIPDTVTDIGEFVFDGCENLRHIKLPSQLKCLWGHTFVRSSIEEIVLPDTVESIPPFAFKDCRHLQRVARDYTFNTKSKLRDLYISGGFINVYGVIC